MQPDGTPDHADIVLAQARLHGIAHRTPVLTSRSADAASGAALFFKAENLQRTGSFKFRGAVNALACLSPQARRAGVVAFSSGNHAQALACAAALAHTPCCIVMPADAPASKRDATAGYGAEIILYNRRTEDREAIAAHLATTRGLTLLPPFDHADVIAGQATCAAELIEQAGPLDVLLACVGGGGLLAGCALAAATRAPGCRVIGVEPDAGNDAQRSLAAGRRVRIEVPCSIADGALTTQIGALPFAILQRLPVRIVTVADTALIGAMRFFAERMKTVVEPTGCLAAAAVFSGVVPTAGLRVGVVLSGGNISLARLAALLG